jgi:hypothetical protein
MCRRRVAVIAAAVFAIGVAFAAQPTSLRADWGERDGQGGTLWVPGTNELMSSTSESGMPSLAPPR